MAKGLYTEQAISEFADFLLLLDSDQVLEAAGLNRVDLIALSSDEAVSSCVDIRREAILSTPYKFMDDTDGFVESQLSPLLDHIIATAHNAVYYGYSVLECVYRKQGMDTVLDKCLEKPFYWFFPDYYGGLYFNKEFTYTRYQPHILPAGEKVDTRYKFALSRSLPTYDNPRGVAMLSTLYWPVHFRRNGWKFWVQFLERAAIPKLVGKSGDVNAMATALADAVQDATISIGRDDEVLSLEAATTGESFRTLEVAIIKRIQVKILGRILTGDLESGSYAAQKFEGDLPDAKKTADIRLVSSTVQHICNAITDLNAMPRVIFRMGDFGGLNRERAERDKILVDSGIVRFTPAYIEREYNFYPEDFTVPTPAALSFTAGHNIATLAAEKPQAFTPDQQDVEDLIGLTQAALTPNYSEILKIIKESPTESAMLAALDKHTAALPMDSDPNGTIERSLFLAEVLGYVNASTGKGEPPPREGDPDGE